jgi:hypothetical protein
MDQDLKRKVENDVKMKIAQMVASIGGTEQHSGVTFIDDDAGPLFGVLKEHMVVSVACVVRLEDYLQSNPQEV